MMHSLRRYLYLIILALMLFPITEAWSADCTMEAKQQQQQKLREEAKQQCVQMKADAAKYNELAKGFIQSCDPNLKPSEMTMPTEAQLRDAELAGERINDSEIYQYMNIKWNEAKIPEDESKKQECLQKKAEIEAAYQTFYNSYKEAIRKVDSTSDNSLSSCACDEQGQNPTCETISPETENMEASNGICKLVTYFLNILSSCPLCSLFEVILRTDAEIAHISWEATAIHLSKIVGIFFFVMLALEALKAVASVGGLKPSAFIKRVLVLMLKFGIVLLLLSNSKYIYGLFISPVIQGGLDMGTAIANASGSTPAACEAVGSIPSQEFDSKFFNSVLCTVKSFGESAATLPAIGMGLACHAFDGWVPNLSMFASGLIMLGFGIMIWLAFSFYLVDATVQLGMLSALVPLLIACWPLEVTKQYTVKGIKMLMNSFFTFVLAGVLLLLGQHIMTSVIKGHGNTTMEDIMQAINDNSNELEQITALDGMTILMMIACGIFAMKLIANLSNIAGQFSSGSGTDMGSKMGGLVASAATGAGLFMAKGGGKLGKAGLQAIGDNTAIGQSVQKGARSIMSGARSTMGSVQQGWGNMWAKAGSKLSGGKLDRFQNRNAGSATQAAGTKPEQNRDAKPTATETPPPPPDTPATTPPEDEET